MIYHILRASLNRFGKTPAELEETQIQEIRTQALREYKIEQTVLNSGEARDVHVPDSVVTEALDRIVARYPDRDSFMQDLDDNRLTEKEFIASIRQELLATAVLDRVGSRAADISEIDCMLYYYMHKDRFDQPETREACHILITINDDYPENREPEARKRLGDILSRVQTKPKRFAEQAMKHSECPTAMNGGFLGKLPQGQLFVDLDKTLFGMQEGEISDIVQSPLGYHILYCQAIHAAGPVGYKEAKPRIQEFLQKRRSRMCQKSWLSELTGHHKSQDDNNA